MALHLHPYVIHRFSIPVHITPLWAVTAVAAIAALTQHSIIAEAITLVDSITATQLTIPTIYTTQTVLGYAGVAVYSVFLTALLFGSVLVHECAHAAGARVRGMSVSYISLVAFGGATAIDTQDASQSNMAVLVGAGPVATAVIATTLYTTWTILPPGTSPAITSLLILTATFNAMMFTVNSIPLPQLDGGRFMTAMCTHLLSQRTATRIRQISSTVSGITLAMILGRNNGITGIMFIAVVFIAAEYHASQNQPSQSSRSSYRAVPSTALDSGHVVITDSVAAETTARVHDAVLAHGGVVDAHITTDTDYIVAPETHIEKYTDLAAQYNATTVSPHGIPSASNK